MRLKIPMTGTVVDYDPALAALDGIGVLGDPANPVRVVNLNLGGVSWRLVGIDLANDLMEVEVEAPETIEVDAFDAQGNAILDVQGKPQKVSRPATPAEKEAILSNAVHLIESKTIDEIYALAGDKRLVKPAAVMKKYQEAHKDVLAG